MGTVYVCKPGCNFQPKANKTNLQIRELEAFRSAICRAQQDSNVELVTIDALAQVQDRLPGSTIVCFNSAKCFDAELIQLIQLCSITEDLSLILVSNDCRLNFNVYDKCKEACDNLLLHMTQGRCLLYMLTNATTNLLDYQKLVIDWPLATTIPIASSNLYTLPVFMSGASTTEKTVDCVFTCMHFKDYSKQRQNDLQNLKYYLGDRLVVSGDAEGLHYNGQQVDAIVTDTKDVWQWYCNAKTTPVLLEPAYAMHGVIPNRVSEAIACKCLPIFYLHNVEELEMYDYEQLPMPFVVSDDTLDMYKTIDMYCKAYDEKGMTMLIKRCENKLQADATAFVQQLIALLRK